MLAKKTVKNQITLPKTVVARFGNVEYFEVSTDGETIVLRPLRTSRLDEVRAKLVWETNVSSAGAPFLGAQLQPSTAQQCMRPTSSR